MQIRDWPTIPQLYIKGEFIGGCDIVTEMFREGELQNTLRKYFLILFAYSFDVLVTGFHWFL